MNTRLSTLSMAMAIAFASPAALALGLGQMQVKSGLNQPLLAEIPIVSAAPAELNELDVRLASPEAFAAVGLDRPYGLSANLQFSIGKNASGQPVVRITTAGRFNEPVLSFLMEAKWATGTVTREYTALIDPPYIAPAVVKPMSAPAIAEAPAPEPPMATAPEASAPTPPPIPAQTEPASEPAPAMASPLPSPVVQQPAAPAPVAVAPAPKPSHQTPAAPAPKPVAAPKPAAPPKPVVAAPKPAPAPAAAGDFGPVADGKTLWSIANQVRPDASVSVNQVMLALLRVNPEAFTDSNINRLKSGAVLRIPNRDEIATLTPDDAAALVREQAAAWKTPLQATPQPAQGVAESVAPAPVASAPARAPSARLEIVPPSGKASARGTQSGATAGGGSELRAELLQTNEELAARTAEVTELKSRVSDLEKQEADRQHLIDLQNSQLKDLQTRLQEKEAAPAAAAPATSPEVASADDVVKETPIYFNPWVLGGGGLILVGGLVFAMRRKPAVIGAEDTTSRRISDDEALRASLAKTRAAIIRPGATPAAPAPAPEPVVAPVPAEPIGDSELDALVHAVQQNPRDTEAHLNLLRLYHARGNAVEYEEAAQAMRGQIATTLDPRWREAVIMGASLLPGHALFNQAGWNTPRFGVPDPVASPVTDSMPEVAPVPAIEAAVPMSASGVFDLPEHEDSEPAMSAEAAHPDESSHAEASHVDEMHEFGEGELDLIDAPGDLANAIPGSNDIHRSESQVQEEDEASATRIELAKAYLDIGDLDGARSMLEEVLAEGGPAAKAEAERILREIG